MAKRKTYRLRNSDGKLVRASKKVWNSFHPRDARGHFIETTRAEKRRLASFPGKRNVAHAVKTPNPSKTRFTTLVSPNARPVLLGERSTKMEYNDPNHNPDVLSGMMASLFHAMRAKLHGKFITGWSGGVVFLLSTKDDKKGRPQWQYPPKGYSTPLYSDFATAIKDGQAKVRGSFDSEASTVTSEHRYRIWVQRIQVWAYIAGAAPLLNQAARKGRAKVAKRKATKRTATRKNVTPKEALADMRSSYAAKRKAKKAPKRKGR